MSDVADTLPGLRYKLHVPRSDRLARLTAFAAAGLASSLLALVPFSARAADLFTTVYLSEFLADNQRGLRDDDRDRAAWIELHNGGHSTVNLAGWFLTDTPTNLTKWRFPRVWLLPDKYMVVFASGKNRISDLAHLHTNFRLDKRGGYLALVNPATNVVSEFAPAEQFTDISDGRVRGEPAIRGQFAKPTPGKPNASSGKGFAPPVRFSKPGGNFTQPFAVELSCASTGAVIRYTLDGALPSRNSPIYSGALPVTNSVQLRARTFEEGLLPGPPHSEAYLLLASNVLEFTSTLPVLMMDTLGSGMRVSSQDTFVHLAFHEPVNGRTSLTNPPALTTRAGFHIRGSTSAHFPQSSFAVEFLDEFGEEINLAVLGLPPDSDWVLYAPNYYDPVLIHNPFIHQLSRDMGRYSPRTRFVEVFLARSAGPVRDVHYEGLYVLEEKIKIGKHRVNIDRVGAEDLKAPEVTGGYLLKFDRLGPGESGLYSRGERGLVYVDPKEQTITLPQRAAQERYLIEFFTGFERALYGPNWKDPNAGYAAYLDVEAAIDYHVLQVLSGNVDAMVLSTFFHKPRDGKITFGPHWDFDRALGSRDRRDANPRRWNTGAFFGGAWWPRLFSDVDFWQLWVDRWQELRRTHFSLGNLYGLIDRLAAELRDAQPRQHARWAMSPRGGSYQSELDLMKDWLSNRIDFIDGQLVQPPHFSRDGGQVARGFSLTLSAPTNATIYYTLDGSDPRLPQGEISPAAFIYTEPIRLKSDARILARAHDLNQRQFAGPRSSTPWSAPARGSFVISLP